MNLKCNSKITFWLPKMIRKPSTCSPHLWHSKIMWKKFGLKLYWNWYHLNWLFTKRLFSCKLLSPGISVRLWNLKVWMIKTAKSLWYYVLFLLRHTMKSRLSSKSSRSHKLFIRMTKIDLLHLQFVNGYWISSEDCDMILISLIWTKKRSLTIHSMSTRANWWISLACQWP